MGFQRLSKDIIGVSVYARMQAIKKGFLVTSSSFPVTPEGISSFVGAGIKARFQADNQWSPPPWIYGTFQEIPGIPNGPKAT